MKLSTRIVFITTLFGLVACGSSGSSDDDDGRNALRLGVIFETDFSNDEGYFATNEVLINTVNVPSGWDGVLATGNGSIEVLTDLAIAPKPVLKVKWDPNQTQPTTRLLKHLTGNINTGFRELYIRYRVRLPNNFKAGDGVTLNHWKWGRLWQNTSPTIVSPGQPGAWTENRADSRPVVWNFNGSPPFTNINSIWGANVGVNLDKGSNGGERYRVDYFFPGSNPLPEVDDGYFESVGNGAWDIFTQAESPAQAGFLKNKNQTWHTIEYHFKLATSPGSNDGVQRVWFDGVLQSERGPGFPGWGRILNQGGAPPVSGLPTVKDGSGFNMFLLFDNMQNWNVDWDQPGVDGFIYVSDIVISDGRIGHSYSPGGLY